jgi:sphingomyelin phosphodiesterase acid-like 3
MRMRWMGWVGATVLVCGVASGQVVKRAAGGGLEQAQAPAAVSALMMSDIHFDPFRDPSKAQRLVDASEGEWNGILAEPDAPDAREAFASLQKTCHETSADAPYALFQSSLKAMREYAPEAKFAVMSGDLLVHSFDCRFRTLLPGRPQSDYRTFAEKTERYVIEQTRLALKGVPVYVALGNNDASCKDYAIDPGSGFLKATEGAALGEVPAGAEKNAAIENYDQMGDYSMMMLSPMQRTRLIVLDDLFSSSRYTDCSGKADRTMADAQIAWLDKELAGAKARGERVWVMAHIPPGLDTYSTLSKFKNVCAGDDPVMMLSSERLAEVMAKYADVIRLAVFGHAHMDEMRLYGGVEDGVPTKGAAGAGKVAIKILPPITPLASGIAEFTVAKVDPATARMVDYDVYASSNGTGVDATWKKTYSFGRTYHVAAYTPETLQGLIDGFEADPAVRGEASQAYMSHVIAGEKGMMLKLLWPQYACAMQHDTVKGYAGCLCGTDK